MPVQEAKKNVRRSSSAFSFPSLSQLGTSAHRIAQAEFSLFPSASLERLPPPRTRPPQACLLGDLNPATMKKTILYCHPPP